MYALSNSGSDEVGDTVAPGTATLVAFESCVVVFAGKATAVANGGLLPFGLTRFVTGWSARMAYAARI